MKTALALLFCVAVAGWAAEDSPLVKAAKASGGPKRKPKAKVITNDDVKKSKAKVTVLPPATSSQPAGADPATPEKGLIEQHDEQRRAEKEASERVVAAEQKVADLEKELYRLEQSYYESADPNYRDNTIEARFQQTKKQLEAARKDLADARDAAQKIATKQQ